MKIAIQDRSHSDFEQSARRNKDVIEKIENGLTDFNRSVQPDPDASPLVLVVEDGEETVGGVLGRSAYGWMRIDVAWVTERLRGQGLGKALLERAEEIARARGCIGIHLDTHGFQAPAFYEHLGYEAFATLSDYPKGQQHYFFKKKLTSYNRG